MTIRLQITDVHNCNGISRHIDQADQDAVAYNHSSGGGKMSPNSLPLPPSRTPPPQKDEQQINKIYIIYLFIPPR